MDAARIAYIESRVEKVPPSGCWVWTGALHHGYGQLTYKGKHHIAHRFAYEAMHGPIPKGALICHRCDVRECCNPAHVYAGDFATNRADMLSRNRWRHPWGARDSCAKGHRYEDVGYRIAKDGSRVCHECMRQHQANFRVRRKV